MADDHLTLLTAKEAAAYLRISLFTLNRMEKEGHVVPFRTPGGHRRYSLGMLNDYLTSSRSPQRVNQDNTNGHDIVSHNAEHRPSHAPARETSRLDRVQPNHRGRVLVVDDQPDVCRLIARILSAKGFHVSQASGGIEAEAILAQRSFDLLVTDLSMPDMDGVVLQDLCRQRYPDMDVVVLTANDSVATAVSVMKNGAFDYVTKPFNGTELERVVSACFALRASRTGSTEAAITPLVDLGRTLASSMSLAETLNSILDLLQRTFRPISSEAVVFDASLESDVIVALRGEPPESLGYPRPDRAEVLRLAGQAETWLLRDQGASSGQARATSGHVITVPLTYGNDVVGSLTLVREQQAPPYRRNDAQLLQVFGYQIGTSMIHARTHQRLLDSFRNYKGATLSTVQTLFAAIETYDQYTHDHSERVSVYAHRLGTRIGLPDNELEQLRIAGLLHDIGKLGIGDETLHKNAGLTPAELDRVKLHPVWGARILGGLEAFAHTIPLVRHHHERYDGEGYPDHLEGDAIPLGARIIAIVDAFDSMTSDRPYRQAQSTAEALSSLNMGGNSQWDAWLVREWSKLVEEESIALEQPLTRLYARRSLESEL
ncbi:MAG: GAF and HD-GYP domain-containing protein [Anaerolineae bacterium]